MASISQKSINTLTESERQQIAVLIESYFPYLGEDFIRSKTVSGPDYDVVLLKKKDTVLGVSYYKTYELKTPFHPNKVPVIHFDLALKKPGYKGKVIRKMGRWYAIKKIGIFFPFKRIVGISEITSPRVMENFAKRFPLNSMNFPAHSSATIFRFVQNFFSEHRKMDIEIDFNSCFDLRDPMKEEVTDSWNKYFKAKNESINDLFLNSLIFTTEGDQIFKSEKAYVACGYRAGFSKV
jgi:hypothetical protein